VARSGGAYRVTVAAEMDMFPKYVPWVYITPSIAGAIVDGKLCLDVSWHRNLTFADVIGAVVTYVEGVCGAAKIPELQE